MRNISQLSRKLDELEKATDENNQVRVIIYDPANDAPIIPDDNSDAVIFLIPDNGRDYFPGNNAGGL